MSPRDLLLADHRSLFGRATSVEWRTARSTEELVLQRAAQMQHEAALTLWRRLRAHGESVGELAERNSVNAEGLRRKLRGETWANLRDVAAWELCSDL